MYDTVHHVMWYTMYGAKTGDLIASGTSKMCARRLGYKSANSFASASEARAASACFAAAISGYFGCNCDCR